MLDAKHIPVYVCCEEQYDVLVKPKIMRNSLDLIQRRSSQSLEAYALVDENVARFHLDYLKFPFINANFPLEVIPISSGEEHKSIETYQYVVDQLIKRGMRRRSVLLLIGGGVVMDMGGFVGATFMRGVPVVNVPTTLVAQIDAAIGGKVAINHPVGKNLIGAFYNPKLVLTDPYFLSTLTKSQMRDGLAEIIKTAVIASPELFTLVEKSHQQIFDQDPDILEELIVLTVQTKVELLKNDPLEIDLKRLLNFGHSLAHPLETIYEYEGLTHGEAVAIGMATATRFATMQKLCSPETGQRIINLLKEVGLPIRINIASNYEQLVEAILMVVKIRNGVLNFVVPQKIGKATIIEKIPLQEVVACLEG